MTKEEANKKIADLLQQAYNALAEAESVADEHDLYFRFDNGVYGMGGSYEDGEWYASSQSC